MSLIDGLLAKLAPHECLGCYAEGSLLCTTCLRALPPAPEGSQAFTLYQGRAKDLLWKLKSAGAQDAAAIMADCMTDKLPNTKTAWLVPLPTASGRIRQRGYDQAYLITRELSKRTGLPSLKCLARSGQAHQVGSSRQVRLEQLSDALSVRKLRLVKDAHLILIDDVTTTGASFQTAKNILLAAGASRVDALAFAYTPPPTKHPNDTPINRQA